MNRFTLSDLAQGLGRFFCERGTNRSLLSYSQQYSFEDTMRVWGFVPDFLCANR